MAREILTKEEVLAKFEDEFKPVREKFAVFPLTLSEAMSGGEPGMWNPGVYVHWHPDRGVIRVGRHLVNSKKRAIQHITGNTGGTMNELEKDDQAEVILFNVIDPDDRHWVAAVEIFMEKNLDPEIRAGRLG